jgi:hypothetical protein
MSEEIESLAREILDQTTAGKLTWRAVKNETSEEFRADIADDQSITVRRTSQGYNMQIWLGFFAAENLILEDRVDNFIAASAGTVLATLGINAPAEAVTGLLKTLSPDLSRFDLYSELFLAAKRAAMGLGTAIMKFKETLQKGRDGQTPNPPLDKSVNAA